MGRPNGGVDRAALAAKMSLRYRQVREKLVDTSRPESRERMLRETLELEPGKGGLSSLRMQYSQPLRILMIVAGLILLIACANVANLLLARATARTGEAAVRLALGAPRWRLIRQSLIESLLLALTGVIAALVLAALGSRALLALVSSGSEPIVLDLAMNGRLVLFSIAAGALTAMLSGLAPALRGSRADVRGALGAVGKRTTDGKGRRSLRSALAVVQLALAVVLVVCAGLFLRTITNLAVAEGGFDRENVLMVRMAAGDAGYGLARGEVPQAEREAAEARLLGLLARLIARLESVPGVASVTKSECGFLTACQSSTTRPLFVDGQPSASPNAGVRYEHVWPGYVRTMGMTLLAGRELAAEDGPRAPPVALINETLARARFGGAGSAVGKTFRFENDTVIWQVAGVVKDVRHRGPRSELAPYIYYPHAQRPSDFVALTIRTLVPPGTLAQPVREAIAEVENSLNVASVNTLDQQFEGVIRRELLLARLTAGFGLLALALTCVGLYGLLAYSVARRTNEIGLRMALGAHQWAIVRGILRQTVALVAIGVSAGLGIALAASRLAEGQLYDVTPHDPATIAVAAGTVLLVGLLAAGVPARRAARFEPMQALRYD